MGRAAMAKVLFIMKYPLEDAYSVKNKFDGQMRAARMLGHDVYFVAYDHKHTYLIHGEEKKILKNIWFGNWKIYIHTKAFWDLFTSVSKALKTERFDVVYMRRCPLCYTGYRMCRRITDSGAKLVEEIPTYPGREGQPTFLRRIYLEYSRYWWRKVHPKLTMYTLIGEHADSIGEIPALNIENGTDVDLFALRQPKPEEKIHLLALASMCRWHGYDRLIQGLAEAPEDIRSGVIVDMVGDAGDGSLHEWKAMVEQLGLQEQVRFHGNKQGEELTAFFNSADIGVCSLGLYRVGFSSGSILKLREYVSRGLPFVCAGEDPSIPGDAPYALQIPNDDSPVDMVPVIDFAKKMRQMPEIPAQMRQYAKENMTWTAQMQKVFSALGF